MSRPRGQSPDDGEDLDGPIIDVNPPSGRRGRRRRIWLLAVLILLLLFVLGRAGDVYIESLWYGSLGYSAVYWTSFKYGWAVFAIFAVATAVILRLAFFLLERSFAVTTLAPRRIVLNNEQVFVKPGRILKPAAWVVSLLFGLV